MTTPTKEPTAAPAAVSDGSTPIRITRRRIDTLAVGAGLAAVVVLVVAGGLLTWGSNFSEDYVGDELAAQNITFPPEDALAEEGREDLARFGGEQVNTGKEAEAYASYIKGHVEGIADGGTFAELREPQVAAEEALNEAVQSNAPADEVAALQEDLDGINGQRESIFQGEILRGTLLNTFAWSTIGRIAGIAATVAFVAAAVMAALVAAGVFHLRKLQHSH